MELGGKLRLPVETNIGSLDLRAAGIKFDDWVGLGRLRGLRLRLEDYCALPYFLTTLPCLARHVLTLSTEISEEAIMRLTSVMGDTLRAYMNRF